MSSCLQYKGYTTEIHYSVEDRVLYGKIDGIDDYIDFEAASPDEIEKEFHSAVDEYLIFCQNHGKKPNKSYKGSFNVRISPELHRQAAAYANAHHISLNKTVENALSSYIIPRYT